MQQAARWTRVTAVRRDLKLTCNLHMPAFSFVATGVGGTPSEGRVVTVPRTYQEAPTYDPPRFASGFRLQTPHVP